MERLCAALLLTAAVSCQAAAPIASYDGPGARVRATELEQAKEVSELFETLAPQVAELLPDTKCRANEVWIQEQPKLYLFSGETYNEADGFWSEHHSRIHLREDASGLERTLAHEIVHASLGESWSVLPGTIEEGLCDVVSVLLAPEDADSMRAGRLSAAAFATGGLELEIELYLPTDESPQEIRIGCLSRMRLSGRVQEGFNPNDVFSIPAGLSTTKMPTSDKKALYGLSYLVVDRVVEHIGFDGLHELCLRTERLGLEEVPSEWLLEAAQMTGAGYRPWREALQQAIGSNELQSLVSSYPELLQSSAARVFGSKATIQVDQTGRAAVAASVRIKGAKNSLDLRLSVKREELAQARFRSIRE